MFYAIVCPFDLAWVDREFVLMVNCEEFVNVDQVFLPGIVEDSKVVAVDTEFENWWWVRKVSVISNDIWWITIERRLYADWSHVLSRRVTKCNTAMFHFLWLIVCTLSQLLSLFDNWIFVSRLKLSWFLERLAILMMIHMTATFALLYLGILPSVVRKTNTTRM